MIERFWLFHYAYARIPRSVVVGGGGWEPVRFPLMGGLAEHSEYGPVLLDVPFGREGPSNLGVLLGSIVQKTGLVFRRQWAVAPRLEQLGFRPADVEHVLMTHLHYDHTGGMKTVAHARFHVCEREWDFAYRGAATAATVRGYVRDDFNALRNRVVRHDRPPHLAETSQGYDVLGDGSVEMFFLPGHTPGHCGYRLCFDDGSAVFFAGDTAFTIPQLYGRQSPGMLPQTFTSSATGADLSRRSLCRHLDEHDRDVPVVCHDLELGARSIDEGPVLFEPEPATGDFFDSF